MSRAQHELGLGPPRTTTLQHPLEVSHAQYELGLTAHPVPSHPLHPARRLVPTCIGCERVMGFGKGLVAKRSPDRAPPQADRWADNPLTWASVSAGEEFAVPLPTTPTEAATGIAGRPRESGADLRCPLGTSGSH